MTPEQYELAGRLFEEACALPADRWESFLDEQQCDDPDVRSMVLLMLAQDKQPSEFIDTPAMGEDFHVATAFQDSIPEQIDRYRIESLIGEGGMGRVYKGLQENPRRTVAVKLLRPGMMARDVLKRFRHEAHVLGRLQHPGIAQIHEAGTFDAGHGIQPYFAMEFVEGRPLLRYADEENLSARERLRLLVKICDAVHHAHQRGVIHRDLKPDNILVDGTGQPKVLDFGVARVTDADVQITTIQTNVGQLIGTLAYMSPEQVAGVSDDIDSRSDVYALGVIAFQLLTGSLPYSVAQRTIPEIARIISEDEPTKLSSNDRQLRGDVETIVSKALDKDPGRRYQSVHGLAADINRFLNDEPIAARPASAMYQLRKFAKRNKAISAGVLIAATALVVATGAAIYGLIMEQQNTREVERRIAIVEGVNEFLTEDLLASVRPNELGIDASMREVLDEASARIEDRFADEPIVEAAVRLAMGSTFKELGEYPKAEPHLRRALDLRREHLGSDSLETIDCIDALGNTLKEWGKYEEASLLLEEALERRRAVVGDEDEGVLQAMNNLAACYDMAGRIDEAADLYVETLDLCRRLLGEEHYGTLIVASNLAVVHSRRSRHEESMQINEEILEIRRRTLGDNHTATLFSINNLAIDYTHVGRYEDAKTLFDEVTAQRREVLGENHPHTIWTEHFLAWLDQEQGKLDEAESHIRLIIDRAREHLPADHWYHGSFQLRLAQILEGLGSEEDAETAYLTAADHLLTVLGEDNKDTQAGIAKLVEFCDRTGRENRAAIWRERLIADDSEIDQ